MMIRTLPVRLCLLAVLAAPFVAAQAQLPLLASPAAPATPTTPATPASPTTPTIPATSITPEQARQALDVLNDPAKRAAITATLEAIARALPATPTGAAPATPTAAAPAPTTPKSAPEGAPLAPNSLGAAVLVGAANFMNQAADWLSDTLHAAHGVALLWVWLVTMATDPVAHELLIELSWRLAVALTGSLAVMWCVARALRPPLRNVIRRLIRLPPALAPTAGTPNRVTGEAAGATDETTESGEARAEQGEVEPRAPPRFDASRLMRRVPLVLATFALYLLPVLAFVVAGHVIAGSALGGTRLARLVLLAVIDSYALSALALHLARAVLAPRHSRVRLLPVPDPTAAYAMRWTTRILIVGVFGYASAEVGLLLGLTQAAHLALLKTTVLVLLGFIAIVVIEKRRAVRGWIRAPDDEQDVVAAVRNRLAAIWHGIALFYLAALWLVWAAELPTGTERLSRALLITVAVGLVARVAIQACIAALDRLVHAGAGLATAYPGLDRRLSLYHPFLRAFVRIVVSVAMLLLFLQLLGFGAVQALIASPLGQRFAGSLTMLTITLLLALLVWEAVNIALERHLAHLTRQAQIAKLARLRTLLPILRTSLLVGVLTVTGLMVLSEIGVNTAPLLASAGIIGVAVGFGAQTLVRDLITGLFLLLENTMQVGDVVSLGGLSGVIEDLSVRTLRLRAEDGSVHVIPFSSVTTVTNMTRDYGQAVIQVSVAYNENVDAVIDVLKAIATEMRADPRFREVILRDLEVYGLDQFVASAVIIKGRLMCTPFGRWSVGREFNRRMKLRFDELGIAMPSADTRLVVDQPLSIRQLPVPTPAPE
jgi:small-conductance mechanosensitive channel